MTEGSLDCRLLIEDWIWSNRVSFFDNPVLCKYAAPFPQYWLRWFDIVEYLLGAIHSFQDIVVLSPKK